VVHEAREVRDRAVGKIVDADDLVATLEQLLADVRPDEAAAPVTPTRFTRHTLLGLNRSRIPARHVRDTRDRLPLTISG